MKYFAEINPCAVQLRHSQINRDNLAKVSSVIKEDCIIATITLGLLCSFAHQLGHSVIVWLKAFTHADVVAGLRRLFALYMCVSTL